MAKKKQIKPLFDKPLLFVTLLPFIESTLIDEIIVVLAEEDSNTFQDEIKSLSSSKIIKVVNGGATRQESVYNGLILSLIHI